MADRPEGDGGGGGGGSAPTEAPRLRLAILLVLGLGATVLLGVLLRPFLPALVTSAVLATLGYPVHRRIQRAVPQPDVAALITTTAIFFLVLLPTLALSVVLIDQLRQGAEWVRGVVESLTSPGGAVTRALDYVAGYLGVESPGLTRPVADQLSGLVGLLARRTFGFLSGLGGWLLQAAAALFTLFYFLRDADGLMRTVKWLVPLDEESTDHLVRRTRDVIYATVFGNVVVGIAQGGLGGLAFWVLGLPAAALWGTVMGILSLLPVVGPTFVWLPAGVILIAEGDVARGIVLLAVGSAVISTVDNYLRAVLIGGRAQLHSLLVFFSVLAGLFAFGAVGIFVGPVLFVIALSVLELARTAMDAAQGGPLVFPGAPGEGILGTGVFRDGSATAGNPGSTRPGRDRDPGRSRGTELPPSEVGPGEPGAG